jgi:hypothetical protein
VEPVYHVDGQAHGENIGNDVQYALPQSTPVEAISRIGLERAARVCQDKDDDHGVGKDSQRQKIDANTEPPFVV